MDPSLRELVHLIVRWVHLIAGIMWIGNSMLFNWLDRNLEPPVASRRGSVGTLWMVHSGGFYEVEKKFLEPAQMPKILHWFKWQNGITWLSGISLLVIVFYMDASAMMVDPAVSHIAPGTAVGLSLCTLILAWMGYDLLWRSPLGKRPVAAFLLSIGVVLVASAVFFALLSGRAAYMHIGVMLGTLMTGNVWFVIMPSQSELVAATLEGREQDPAIGYQAKQRSIHNNYMTFPLLFIMLSGHFPSTFGNKLNWLVLAVLAVGSASIRHFMNIRFGWRNWLYAAGSAFAIACMAVYVLIAHPAGFGAAAVSASLGAPVPFAQAQGIVHTRCVPCHSATPTHHDYRIAPNGVMFDTPDQMTRNAERIRYRAVTLRNMPLANLTHITDAERDTLRRWIDQGARTQ